MRYLTSDQVCRVLGFTPRTIRRWIKRGFLQRQVISSNGHLRFGAKQIHETQAALARHSARLRLGGAFRSGVQSMK
jgi:DNA-binding transcriptional MerR regulator